MLDFIYSYSFWHYTSAIKALLSHVRNFFVFVWNFFSIPGLLVTLFSPWQRLRESYDKGFDVKEKLATLLVNTIMRLVGAFIRIVMVVFGIVALVLYSVLALFLIVTWLLLPAVVGILMVIMFDILL
jgi:hypothetical protein